MRTRLFNIDAFYKYKSVIDKKNILGMWWNFIMFQGLILLDILMKVFVAPERINPVYMVYALVADVTIFVWYRLRKRLKNAQDWSIIFSYIIAIVFTAHCMFMYGTESIIIVYFAFMVDLAATFLMHPAFLAVGQTEGMVIFLVSYIIAGKHVSAQSICIIILTYCFAIALGMLIWHIRLSNVIFENELIYLATGTDEVFLDRKERMIFEGSAGSGIFSNLGERKHRTFTFVYDASKDRLLNVREDNIFSLKKDMNWDEISQRILRYAGDPASYRSVEKFFEKSAIMDELPKEKTNRSLQAGFVTSGGEKMWLIFTMSLRPHPVTGAVMLTVLIEDYTIDHIFKELLNQLISENYDAVLCIEKGRRDGIIFLSEPHKDFRVEKCEDYEALLSKYVTENIADYDREKVLKDGHLKNLYDYLMDHDLYECFVDEYTPEGGSRRMRFMAFYLEEDKRILVILRRDVSFYANRAREAKEKVELALEEAKSANEIRTEFLARMNHEMRIPMNSIVGLASLMEEGNGDPGVLKDYAGKIKDSSDYLLQLVNNMFDMTEVTGGHINLKSASCTFKEILSTVDNLVTPMCEAKGIKFTIDSEIADSTVVMTDKLRLIQIFTNLLEKSVKFTDRDKEISLSCYNIGKEGAKGCFRFVVKDNGAGIDEETAQHLFEPYRCEHSSTDPLEDTGLGLHITKNIVDVMGGKISANGKPGVGTTVVVDLDLLLADSNVSVSGPEFNEKKLEGKNILVAEDNEINREIACELLRKRGVTVYEAPDGEAAVKMFADSKEGSFDAILMDIRMPKMNGLEATRQIRSLERPDAASVPIIAMTANAFSEDIELSINSKMTDHLSKPINPKVLYETLVKAIEERNQ